ncbi:MULTISPECIES: diguanylate cyclase [Bradyrhizobium]|uniref:diguanylate cyclase n=1 Tax=Bradyrhizobium frederickii TaxID=2560054 RepID=A0A4Y9L318_9BRAD|nr:MULTISPECIES: diguanylate cyclase [Bradyrhizobium]RTE92987.1 diguanylate cyclase [Bradyrhizobium sp. LVM 105]TFV37196.1 diguanylate cyclase [Bradyrhizobium frederickii]
MASISLNRKRAKLKQVLGIRARLALLAVILVAPLMFERIRSLEDTRARQIAQATAEFTTIARHSADAQREVISSVETILKAEAFIRASAGGVTKSCDVLRASLPSNLPWIRTLLIAGQDGRIQCATNNMYVGLDLSDRPYFQQAQESGRFVLSDFILSRPAPTPTVMAVYPVSAFSGVADAVVLATVNLDWMSKVMSNLGGRAGITAVLVDSAGTVLAAPADQHSSIGRPLDSMPLMAAIADRALRSDQDEGSLSFLAADGSRRAVSYIRIAGTNARLIASIDEDKVSAAVSRDIRTAYLQLAFVVVFVLLGALIAAEKLVIKPIEMLVDMAKRLGEGDLSARAARNRLPAEFVPLARAFNAMAAQLSQRERELIASNDRLTVMASIDMLSGLANRRGFQSRLDFEWMRAQQYGSDLALLMIDVDHFKLFNDTYGHLEGDSCLTRLGESLSGIAADTMGFAARYGGEEFCLLLPNTDVARAVKIGEQVRATVLKLCLPHITSAHMIVTVSIGVAATKPNESLRPGDLIEAADAALYAAKHRGRNNVVEHGIQAIESGAADMMMAASA